MKYMMKTMYMFQVLKYLTTVEISISSHLNLLIRNQITGILLSHEKEETFILCNSVDRPREQYEISQSEKDKYCMISLIFGM